jgi:hypothetical protein
MVSNRPVIGVRNPVCSTSSVSFSRANNAGIAPSNAGVHPIPGKLKHKVSPVRLLEAATLS